MRPPPVVTDMLAEAELSGDDDLAAVLTALHALGAGPAPAPGPELAARLRPSPLVAPRRRLRRRVVAGAAGLALVAVTATGAAAAANELPPGVQRLVARLSERFLPFDFPSPVDSGRRPPQVHPRTTSRQDPEAAGTRVGYGSGASNPRGVTSEPGTPPREHTAAPARTRPVAAEGQRDGGETAARPSTGGETEDRNGGSSPDGTTDRDNATEPGTGAGENTGQGTDEQQSTTPTTTGDGSSGSGSTGGSEPEPDAAGTSDSGGSSPDGG